ncbi:hypothetical protein [Enterococcus faecium]|uniref:hypothetical protein n=1 Tax=Enterococcus faecium TaxID=1352 RepID=UPI00027C7169|nr:hypothetical protein [Enterococcus faecium]EJV42295.1 hypothetical protein HMPREF1345_02722 [Enterococcus faecium TX1337RF]
MAKYVILKGREKAGLHQVIRTANKNSSSYFSFGWTYSSRCKLVYQEVVSLPFSSESQGAISKNSFSCLLNIVTCDRGVGRRTPFKEEVVKSAL